VAKIQAVLRMLACAILVAISMWFFVKQAIPTATHVIDAYNGDRYTWLAAARLAYVFTAQISLAGYAWSFGRRVRSATWWTKSNLTAEETNTLSTIVTTTVLALISGINIVVVAMTPLVTNTKRQAAAAFGGLCTIYILLLIAYGYLMRRRRSLRHPRR
jgi:hypothetical protein